MSIGSQLAPLPLPLPPRPAPQPMAVEHSLSKGSSKLSYQGPCTFFIRTESETLQLDKRMFFFSSFSDYTSNPLSLVPTPTYHTYNFSAHQQLSLTSLINAISPSLKEKGMRGGENEWTKIPPPFPPLFFLFRLLPHGKLQGGGADSIRPSFFVFSKPFAIFFCRKTPGGLSSSRFLALWGGWGVACKWRLFFFFF